MTALVSNGIPDGSAILLDAAQIAAAATEIDVQVASSATLEMADDPAHDSITPTGASLVSMFETNSLAMRATPATIAATRLNDSALVLVEGIDWGGGA